MGSGFLTTTIIRAVATSVLLMFLVGCSAHRVRYAEVFDLEQGAWPGNGSVIFDYHNPLEMEAQKSELWITSRIDKSFLNNTLALEIKTVKPDKSYWCDTIEMDVRHRGGNQNRMLTSGMETRVMYRSGMQLSQAGKWSFSIRQLNAPQDTLYGIKAIAIELRNQ